MGIKQENAIRNKIMHAPHRFIPNEDNIKFLEKLTEELFLE